MWNARGANSPGDDIEEGRSWRGESISAYLTRTQNIGIYLRLELENFAWSQGRTNLPESGPERRPGLFRFPTRLSIFGPSCYSTRCILSRKVVLPPERARRSEYLLQGADPPPMDRLSTVEFFTTC